LRKPAACAMYRSSVSDAPAISSSVCIVYTSPCSLVTWFKVRVRVRVRVGVRLRVRVTVRVSGQGEG